MSYRGADRSASRDPRVRRGFQRTTTAQYRKRTLVAAAYTVLPGDDVLLIQTNAARTITLPPIRESFERVLTFKDSTGTGAASFTITIDGKDAETVDGAANVTITADRGYLTLIGGDTEWKRIG